MQLCIPLSVRQACLAPAGSRRRLWAASALQRPSCVSKLPITNPPAVNTSCQRTQCQGIQSTVSGKSQINTVPGKCNSRPVRELSGPAPPWKYKTPACGGAPSGVGTYTRTGTSPAGPANVVSLTSLTGGAAGRCPLPPAALFSTKQAAAGWTEPGAAAQTAFSRALLGGA